MGRMLLCGSWQRHDSQNSLVLSIPANIVTSKKVRVNYNAIKYSLILSVACFLRTGEAWIEHWRKNWLKFGMQPDYESMQFIEHNLYYSIGFF